MRKLLLCVLYGLAAGLWLLTAAACKSKTADDIRALAHKELQQTALRYAKNAKDLRITAIEEVFCSNEACILDFTGKSIDENGKPAEQRMELVYYDNPRKTGKARKMTLMYPVRARAAMVAGAMEGYGSAAEFLPVYHHAGMDTISRPVHTVKDIHPLEQNI